MVDTPANSSAFEPVRPDRLCLLFNWPFTTDLPHEATPPEAPPVVRAIEEAIARSLTDDPVFVEFSGGLDSSLVLSLATRVCRRLDHDPPIPLSYRFPTEERDENHFQDFVARWLGLEGCHQVVDLAGRFDFVGSAAQKSLRRFGAVWPPNLAGRLAVWREFAPGTLLTGEGGDEVFGLHRAGQLRDAARAAARLRLARAWNVGRRFVGPRWWRQHAALAELRGEFDMPWLLPNTYEECLRSVARELADEPAGAVAWVEHYLHQPATRVIIHNMRAVGAAAGLAVQSPLMDPVVLVAASATPDFGRATRNVQFARLFGDCLPPQVIRRHWKASLSDAFFGPATSAFARSWHGEMDLGGLATDRLREHWATAEAIHPMTTLLLQHAWVRAPSGAAL